MKQRADGRWEKVVTINGKKKHFYSSAETEKLAKRDFDRQLLNYTETESKGKLFFEVADEWFTIKEKVIEYNTYRRYKRYIAQVKEFLGDRYIKTLSAHDIDLVLNTMARQQYSTKTIKDFLSIIKMIFKYAKKQGYISENISLECEAIAGIPKQDRTPITDEEQQKLRSYLNCTFGTLAYFFVYTGLRKGEALALKWKDIDFQEKTISVNKTLYYVGNKPYVKDCTKTKAGMRSVVLLDNLAEVLKPLKGNSDEFVFNYNGNPYSNAYYNRHWEKFQKESGITTTAHALRHTYATLLFEMGVDEKDAQELMGHSSIQITHDIYTHIRQKHKTALTEKMNNYIKENI